MRSSQRFAWVPSELRSTCSACTFLRSQAGSAAGIGGFAYAWVKYCNKPWHAAEQLSPLHQFLMDKWRLNEFYGAVIVGPLVAIAKLSGNVDRIAVDGLTKVAAYGVQLAG